MRVMRENRENVKASDLLEAGYQEATAWVDASDEPELSIFKGYQVLITGFMVTAAVVYAANKLEEVIEAFNWQGRNTLRVAEALEAVAEELKTLDVGES
jgi:hypothetical protein